MNLVNLIGSGVASVFVLLGQSVVDATPLSYITQSVKTPVGEIVVVADSQTRKVQYYVTCAAKGEELGQIEANLDNQNEIVINLNPLSSFDGYENVYGFEGFNGELDKTQEAYNVYRTVCHQAPSYEAFKSRVEVHSTKKVDLDSFEDLDANLIKLSGQF